ncbi:transcriptional regulator [Massilia sp. 2TAF26]|uniref:transcriptional regulator n=1 Tax=Massilia sp. 2TAF26 TaxID=3233012 RepID=UPI003F9BE8FF
MKPQYVLAAAIAATSVLALAAAPEPLPAPWQLDGKHVKKFTAGVDQADGVKGAKFLSNTSDDSLAWASLTQVVSAQNYVGQRVRFRARVRTRDVDGWAGLWMRVDGAGPARLAFYNSQDRPIKGSTDWQERSVVLDVPQEATRIAFGVIDSGKGTVWIDQLAFEAVGQDVPVDSFRNHSLPASPSL